MVYNINSTKIMNKMPINLVHKLRGGYIKCNSGKRINWKCRGSEPKILQWCNYCGSNFYHREHGDFKRRTTEHKYLKDNDITRKIIGYAINTLKLKSGFKCILTYEIGLLALCLLCVVKLCCPPWLIFNTPYIFNWAWETLCR